MHALKDFFTLPSKSVNMVSYELVTLNPTIFDDDLPVAWAKHSQGRVRGQ